MVHPEMVMILKEEDVLDKWCPYSRRYHSSGSYNRSQNIQDIPEGTRCVGSRCMAWRWVQDPLVTFVANGKPTTTISEYGYCGLAGKL